MSHAPYIRVSRKNIQRAVLCFVLPAVAAFSSMVGFAIINTFMAARMGGDFEGSFATSSQVLSVTNYIVSAMGIIGAIALVPGFIAGIYFLSRHETGDYPYDSRSGRGEASVVPAEIRGWNWGAAMLGWIWGSYYHVWISFLTFVPIVNIFFWIVLGIKGNEWAWRNSPWLSIEHFKSAQRKWAPWGIAIFVVQCLVIAFVLFAPMFSPMDPTGA